MDVIGGIVSNILSSVLGWFNGVLDANEVYVLPLLICVGVGFLFLSSTWPRNWDAPVVTYALWSIAATLLALLLNFSLVDGGLIGLTVATVYACVFSARCWKDRKVLFGIISTLVTFLLLGSLFTVSSLNPNGGYVPGAYNVLRDVVTYMWSLIDWNPS